MQQSLLERLFSIKEKGSTTKTEIIAGITTFFTMVYIVFVNPSVLGDAGMDKQVVFVTTCLIAALGTIAMGLFSNLPIALAPAMGLNAFFAYVVVGKLGYSWKWVWAPFSGARLVYLFSPYSKSVIGSWLRFRFHFAWESVRA